MSKLLSFFKNIFWELVVVFFLILTFNNYLGNDKETIDADGIGYYDYLPSVFMYHDIDRKDKPVSMDSSFYNRIISKGVYIDYKGYKLNKYPCGTAVLISPFFIYTYISQIRIDEDTNGYDFAYQKAVFYAAVFYLFLGLFLFKKLLQLYDINQINIVFLQLLTVLATSVTHYSNNEAAFSHVYSMFAISAFFYFAKSYFVTKNINQFIWACVCLALIALIRNVNIIIVFFIPFLAGSLINLKEGFNTIFKYPAKLLIAILMMVAIISIQCIFWYLQVGKFIVYSYTDEGFNFSSPAFIDILFSYRKGLFVYTPILFISLFGLVRFAFSKQYYLLFTWLFSFLVVNYVLSSWWCWYYGCSFGLRAYIEFYPMFFLLFALLINKLSLWFKVPIVLISLATIPVNIIQTYQYKEFILHWVDMDRKGYWEVFLKQDDRFRGYLWKKKYDVDKYYNIEKQIDIKQIDILANTDVRLMQVNSNNINLFNKVSLIEVKLDNNFDSEDDSKLTLTIRDSLTNTYSYSFNSPLIYLAEQGFNKNQTGIYIMEVPVTENRNQIITLSIYSPKRKNHLNNLKVIFFGMK